MDFQFSVPETPEHLSEPSQAAIKFAAIAGKLAVEERTAVQYRWAP